MVSFGDRQTVQVILLHFPLFLFLFPFHSYCNTIIIADFSLSSPSPGRTAISQWQCFSAVDLHLHSVPSTVCSTVLVGPSSILLNLPDSLYSQGASFRLSLGACPQELHDLFTYYPLKSMRWSSVSCIEVRGRSSLHVAQPTAQQI